MYHLELRQFPHNTWRFNLDAEELQTIVTLWVRGQPVDVGERRWSPLQARLTILEGPALAMVVALAVAARADEPEKPTATATEANPAVPAAGHSIHGSFVRTRPQLPQLSNRK